MIYKIHLIIDPFNLSIICKGDSSFSSSSVGDKRIIPSSALVIVDFMVPWNVLRTLISFEEASALICLHTINISNKISESNNIYCK